MSDRERERERGEGEREGGRKRERRRVSGRDRKGWLREKKRWGISKLWREKESTPFQLPFIFCWNWDTNSKFCLSIVNSGRCFRVNLPESRIL